MEEILDELISPNFEQRLHAIRELIENPDPRARDSLLACLEDQETDIKRVAVQALARLLDTLEDPAIFYGILEKEPNPDQEIEIARLLARFGQKAVLRLQEELFNPDFRRARRAAWALHEVGKIGWLALVETAPKATRDLLHIIIEVLEDIKDPDVDSLCYEWLENGTPQQRFGAARILQDEILKPEWLSKTLLNDDMFLRVKGLYALKVISPNTALPIVEEAIRTANGPIAYLVRDIGKIALYSLTFIELAWFEIVPHLFVGEQPERNGAIWALTQKQEDYNYIFPFLTLALYDQDAYVRFDVAKALVYLDGFEFHKEITDLLARSYTDQIEELINFSAGYLGLFQNIPKLKEPAERELLNDIPADTGPVLAARESIRNLTRHQQWLHEEWWKPWSDPWFRFEIDLLFSRGGDERGIDELITIYPRLKKTQRIRLLRHVSQVHNRKVIDFLRSLLFRETMPVIWTICLALSCQEFSSVPPELIGLLLDRNELTRLATVLAIGRLAIPSAIDSLLSLNNDPSSVVRAMTVWCVGRCVNKSHLSRVVDWIIECSHDSDAWVRLECVRAFLFLGVHWPANDLERLLLDPCIPLKVMALRALEAQPEERFYPILESLRGGEVGRAAGYTRRRIGNYEIWKQSQRRKRR